MTPGAMTKYNRRKLMKTAATSGAALTLPTSTVIANRGPPGDPSYFIKSKDTRTHDSTWFDPEVNHRVALAIGEYDWYCDDNSNMPRTWYDIEVATGVYENDGEDESDFLGRVGVTELFFEWNRGEIDPRSPQNDEYLGAWDNYNYYYPDDYDWIEDALSVAFSLTPPGWAYKAADVASSTAFLISGATDNTESYERSWDFASEGQGDRDRCHAYQLVEVEAYTQRPTFKFTAQSRSSHGARGGLFPATQHTYTAYAPSCGLSTTSTSNVDTDRFRGEFKGAEILKNPQNFNLPPVALKDIDPDDNIRLWKPKSDHQVVNDYEYKE